MEKTEYTDLESVERTVLETTLEIKMQDFRTSLKRVREEKYMKHRNSSYELKVNISVSACPNGADKNTEGWLVVVPDVSLTNICIRRAMSFSLSWIVSVIDVEGNSRFPQSFEINGGKFHTLEILLDADISHLKYLEKSFILKRAYEFLSDGVLTLRCNVYLYLFRVSFGFPSWRLKNSPFFFRKFFGLLPKAVCFENEAEKGYSGDKSTVFDLTSEVFTTPQMQEIFEGLYFGSLKVKPTTSKSKEDITDISENVWVFEARPDKFILSLDEMKDTVGARLLKASSLIRECVEIPLKGKQEKLITLQKADSEIFRIVLYFLLVGTLRGFEFHQLLDVYKFCHLFEMKELQRRCAEYMVEDMPKEIQFETDYANELRYFEELERIAELYSDEYLSELIESRRRENVNLEKNLPRLGMEKSPCFDYYS